MTKVRKNENRSRNHRPMCRKQVKQLDLLRGRDTIRRSSEEWSALDQYYYDKGKATIKTKGATELF